MNRKRRSPADALAHWLAASGWTRKQLAEELGVTEMAVYHWLSGRRQVSVPNALRLQRITHGTLTLDVLCPDFE